MNYLTPQEELESLGDELMAAQQSAEFSNRLVESLIHHNQGLSQANHDLTSRVAGLRNAVICLLIVVTGLLITSAVILMRGAA